MVIIDKELIGEGSESEFKYPNIPLGIYLEKEIQKNVAEYGDTTWMTDVSTEKSMSYSQLLHGIRSVASGLRRRGLRNGDNAVIIGLNFIEIPLMTMGIWRAGGSQACLGVNLPPDVIETRLKELGTKFVLTDVARAERMVEVAKRVDCLLEVFVIGNTAVPGCTSFEELLQDSGDEFPENLDDIDLDSMAWLGYTSGTTGVQKGVVLTQRIVAGSFSRWKITIAAGRNKYFFVSLMNVTAGLLLAIGLTLSHTDIYCMSDFSEEKLLTFIDRSKPSHISIQPAHIAWLCRYEHLDRYDVSSVTNLTTMGSVMNPIYEREIYNKLPNLLYLTTIYGMSEVSAICRTPNPVPRNEGVKLTKEEAIAGRVFGSAGQLDPHCKLKVIDVNTGEKLGPNQIGEIYTQSPFMLKEYLNRPKETEAFLRDGWAQSGDQGYYDEQENIFIVGRFKELIKYRNTHVVPTNVEKHIMTNPAVRDVAVVGLPDDVDGERPFAFVVLSPGSQHVTADELIAFTNERVMDEEKLRGGLRFIDKIPRNGLGKVVRPDLMKLLN